MTEKEQGYKLTLVLERQKATIRRWKGQINCIWYTSREKNKNKYAG